MALDEARIDAVDDAIRRYQQRVTEWKWATPIKDRVRGYGSGTAESGAVKRASMDLTRALAKLRKPS